MKIIKRNGAEAVFDIEKIVMAVTKANEAAEEAVRMTPLQIRRISESVEISCEEMGRSPSVEEIQDLVEKAIMAHGAFEVAKEYITYRYIRSLARQSNTTDDRILSLIECNNGRSSRRTPTRTPPSTLSSVTTWQARSARTSPAASCCPRRSWRLTRPVSSTSTIPTTMPSTCTTAI